VASAVIMPKLVAVPLIVATGIKLGCLS
jgi:hypothetical protein